MLEYLLYQLNLSMLSAMLRGTRFGMECSGSPCDSAEIEDLNLLIVAAQSGEMDTVSADREILERVSLIVDRMHSIEGTV